MNNALPGERPLPAEPQSIFDDYRAVRRVRWLHIRAFKKQPAPVFSVSDVLALVLRDAISLNILQGCTEILIAILARAILYVVTFDNEEGVIHFSARLASEILRLQAADPRLLGRSSGQA